MVETLRRLGSKHVVAFHGDRGLDELSTSGPSQVVELLDGDIRRWTLDPAEHGIPPTDPSALAGGDAEENARAIVDVLEGAAGPQRDIVVLNAAAGLLACGVAPDVDSGLAGAGEAIDSGAARRALGGLVEASQAF